MHRTTTFETDSAPERISSASVRKSSTYDILALHHVYIPSSIIASLNSFVNIELFASKGAYARSRLAGPVSSYDPPTQMPRGWCRWPP